MKVKTGGDVPHESGHFNDQKNKIDVAPFAGSDSDDEEKKLNNSIKKQRSVRKSVTRKLNLNPDQISPEEDEPIEVVLKRKVEEAKAKAAKNPTP